MKVKVLYRTLLILYLIFVCSGIGNAQEYTTVINGRAIDENGNPVKGASIGLRSITGVLGTDSTSWYESQVLSDNDGIFNVKNTSKIKVRNRQLFVSAPMPERARVLGYPPTEYLLNSIIPFYGIPIQINGEEKIQIGDVPIQLYYGIVKLKLLKNNGKPIYKSLDEWRLHLTIVLRDENGKFIDAGGLSLDDVRNSIDLKKGTITLAIPEGKWQLGIIHDEDPEHPRDNFDNVDGSTEVFEVKHENSYLSITLKVQK